MSDDLELEAWFLFVMRLDLEDAVAMRLFWRGLKERTKTGID